MVFFLREFDLRRSLYSRVVVCIVLGWMFILQTAFGYQWACDGRFLYGKDPDCADARLFEELACLPDRLWVNLSPYLSPEGVLPAVLWAGDVGRILLETDLTLKRISAELIRERLDWNEEVVFRIVVYIKSGQIGIYSNGRTVENLNLGVRFFCKDKRWEKILNQRIRPYLEEMVNFSDEFSDLRRLVQLYALSHSNVCGFLDRVYMGQEWNDKFSALVRYRSMWEDGLVGGVILDLKNLKEINYKDNTFPVEGREKVDLADGTDLKNKQLLLWSVGIVKDYFRKIDFPFSPEERLLKDLLRVRVIRDNVNFSEKDMPGEIYEFDVSDIDVLGPNTLREIKEIWRDVRKKYWEEVKDNLEQIMKGAVEKIDPEKRCSWSIEGGIRDGEVYVYQIRPIQTSVDFDFLSWDPDKFKENLIKALEKLSPRFQLDYGINFDAVIELVKEGRLEKAVDQFWTQCWGLQQQYPGKKNIFLDILGIINAKLGSEEKVVLDWILLFSVQGYHFEMSKFLVALVKIKGVDYLVNWIKRAIQFVSDLGIEGLSRLGGHEFYKGDGTQPEWKKKNVPLFGVAGSIALWPGAAGNDDPIARTNYIELLSRLKAQLSDDQWRFLVDRINLSLGDGDPRAFFEHWEVSERMIEALEEFLGKSKREERKEKEEGQKRLDTERGVRKDIKEISILPVVKGNFGSEVIGRVRVLRSPKDVFDVEDGDILVVKDLPPNYPQIAGLPAGVVVIGEVVEGQHAFLYVKQKGIPLVRIPEEEGITLSLFDHLNGKWIKLDLKRKSLILSSQREGEAFVKEMLLPYKQRLEEQIKSFAEKIQQGMANLEEVIVKDLDEKLSPSDFGVKAWRLSELLRAGMNVPKGVVVSLGLLRWVVRQIRFDRKEWKEEFSRSAEEGKATDGLKAIARQIQSEILHVDLGSILTDVWDALEKLRGTKLIVRSVSSLEDREDVPFIGTGVLESIVVDEASKENIGRVIKQVLCSMFSENSLEEKVKLGIDPIDVGMGVIIQELVKEDIGFVGEVSSNSVSVDVVLGNNSIITGKGKKMSAISDFSSTDVFVFNPTAGVRERVREIFEGASIVTKVFRFWREALLCLSRWPDERYRLIWVELWNRLLLAGDEELSAVIRQEYDKILEGARNEGGLKRKIDLFLICDLPWLVLTKDSPVDPDLRGRVKGYLKDFLDPAGISGLQVIAKVRPDLFSLKELTELSKDPRMHRSVANLLWYVSDSTPEGVVRGVKLPDSNSTDVGGIWIEEDQVLNTGR